MHSEKQLIPASLLPSVSPSLPHSLFLFLASIIITCILLPQRADAQLTKPDMSFETYGVVSSSGTTPFWLQSNRHGMFAPDGSHILTRFQAHGLETFGGSDGDRFTLRYGADLIARPGSSSTLSFNQGYLRLDAWGLFLQAGTVSQHVSPDYMMRS
jgi:hypothetical protein